MIKVLLADDHNIVRAGLRRIVDASPDMEVVAEAADGFLGALEIVIGPGGDSRILDRPLAGAAAAVAGAAGLGLSRRLRAIGRHGAVLR